MNYNLADVAMVIIQSKYPGGMQKFVEEGGMVGVAQVDQVELVVYHKELPVELSNMLKTFADSRGCTYRALTTLNYTGHEPEEIMELLYTNLEKIVGDLNPNEVRLLPHPLFNDIALLNDDSTRQQAEQIVERMRAVLPNCIRTYVRYGLGKAICSEYPLIEAAPVQAVLEAHNRQTVINDDDMLNLRIALETQSVDDFINSL
jgi:hypothetical protein